MDRRRLLRRSMLSTVAVLALAVSAPVAGAATTEFPDGYEGYHTYAEMEAAIDAAVAAHPGIVAKFSIGRSHEGRQIWAVKISDRVGTDENEPEALFEAVHHAREHLTVEMSLYLVRLLTDNYGAAGSLGERVTDIVRSREIFIVPMLNPDGAEYDISSGTFRKWRHNRQPIPGSNHVGLDLNRNWGYNWGCCRGSSPTPGKETYRGPSPWFSPEVVALRDFVNSRVIDGRQQIRAAVSWHTYGEKVMWPYAYTTTDLPKSMSADDLAALRALGTQMAARNGYRAMQSSDLYVMDGSASDWLYNEHRIMAFTVEMYPPDPSKLGNFYPPDDMIATETARNRDAVLWLLEQADCPHRSAGLAANCGPLYDDFETGRGWTVNPAGTDTALAGAWQRGVPSKTKTSAGVKQKSVVPSGQAALVTGLAAGSSAAANDVDGGVTSALTQEFKLGSADSQGWTLSFSYSFAHNKKARSDDYLSVSVLGSSTPLFMLRGAARDRDAVWTKASVDLDAFAGQTIRLLVEARDGGADNILEAAIDDVRVFKP